MANMYFMHFCFCVILILLRVMMTHSAGHVIYDTSIHCVTESNIYLACPSNHYVIIIKAQYRRPAVPGCNKTTTDYCLVQDVKDQLFHQCYDTKHCEINMVNLRNQFLKSQTCPSEVWRGEDYLYLQHTCEAKVMLDSSGRGMVIQMCDTAAYTGSIFQLWSPNLPFWSNLQHCGCVSQIHRDTLVYVTTLHFETKTVSPASCLAKLRIKGEGDVTTLCPVKSNNFSSIYENIHKSNLSIVFENPNKVTSAFAVIIKVHFQQNLTITCSPTYKIPESKTTVTTEPTTLPPFPNVNTPDPHLTTVKTGKSLHPDNIATKKQDSVKMIIILTGSALAVVLLIISVILLVIHRHRKKNEERQKASGAAETKRYAHDNVIYMHHDEIQRARANITQCETNPRSDGDAASIAGASSIHTVYEEIGDDQVYEEIDDDQVDATSHQSGWTTDVYL